MAANHKWGQSCWACSKSLAYENKLAEVRETNSQAEAKQGKWPLWGAWLGIFPGLLIGIPLGGPCIGIPIIGVTALVGWYVGYSLARDFFPVIPEPKREEFESQPKDQETHKALE